MTTSMRLARLLLQFCANGEQTQSSMRIHCPFSHEELGLYLGVSEETVTSYLADLKSLELLELRGSTLLIPNLRALEVYAQQSTS